jgi:S1-C subfamily serine protease
MRNVQRTNTVVFLLLLSLIFAGRALAQTSPGAKGGSERAGTAGKQIVLPDFVDLAEKLAPVVVNIATTQLIKQAPTPFGSEDPFTEFWKRFFGEPDHRIFASKGLAPASSSKPMALS